MLHVDSSFFFFWVVVCSRLQQQLSVCCCCCYSYSPSWFFLIIISFLKKEIVFRKVFKRKLLVGCCSNVQIMSTISLLNGVVVVESIDDTAAEGPFHLNANSFWFVSENIYLKEKEREREREEMRPLLGRRKRVGGNSFVPKSLHVEHGLAISSNKTQVRRHTVDQIGQHRHAYRPAAEATGGGGADGWRPPIVKDGHRPVWSHFFFFLFYSAARCKRPKEQHISSESLGTCALFGRTCVLLISANNCSDLLCCPISK